MNITKHALKRMAERGFTPEMLVALMNGKYTILSTRDDKFLVIGKADGNFWTLVLAKDMYSVVSVRRSHNSEVVKWNSK
ncbi:MAG: DUF4258 domain-containing protein [Fibrobacter sp.]|jgi:uncharacterized DUF497 family protein|nr:DUF4258 domain-containing protein [Fibrobacter sp.]